MKHSERILSKISDKECKRISRKVIKSLIKRSGKSPEDYAVLNNLWDEICVQVQDSYSFMWDAYEDTIFSLLMSEVKQLEGHIA